MYPGEAYGIGPLALPEFQRRRYPDSAGLAGALCAGGKKWEYQQISPYSQDEFYRLLSEASYISGDPQYAGSASRMGGKRM